jgi:hydrophobe/amphiphile efflux-3 (HAE3) family protein
MISNWWQPVGKWLGRRTLATVVAVVVVTLALGVGVTRLDFATGQDSYLDPDSQTATDNRAYQQLFGGETMIVLFTVPDDKTLADFFVSDNIAQLNEMEATLLADDEVVHSVVSPVALLQWTNDLVAKGTALQILGRAGERDPSEDSKALRAADQALTLARVAAAGEQSLDNPGWVHFLLFDNSGFSLAADGSVQGPADDDLQVRKALRAFMPDSRHAVFGAVLTGNAPLDALADGSSAVKQALEGRTFENAEVVVTGTPTFLTDINDYLQGGMLTLGGIAVLVMVVILVVAFKVRWRLLPLAGMVVGVVWGFGAFGFTGTDLSLVTIAGLPILIGLGIEFSIQMQNRIEEQRALDAGGDPFGVSAHHLGPPMLAATLAAVAAFLTMKISRVPMVQEFGVLLSIGIVALLLAGVVLPTAMIGARERRSPTTAAPRETWVEATVHRLGSLPRAAVLPLVVLAVAVPVVGLALEDGARIESDPVNWANQGSTSIRNARTLESETGFSSTLGVLVQADPQVAGNGVFTDQMGAFQFDLVTASLADNSELAQASSLATTVGWLIEVPGATPLAPTGLDMLQAYEMAPTTLQQLMVADDGNAAQVLFQVGPSSLEERAAVLDRVDAMIADPGEGALLPRNATVTSGGLAVVGVGLLENITANRAQLTIVALLLVAAFLVLRYRDLARGLLTMVPVCLAVGTSAVLVRVLGITLSPLTTVSGPLVVATCAEFSVLLIDRYAEERARGLDPDTSNRVAAARTGRAFFTSALTTLGGFAVLMFSSLPLLSDFGMVVTVNIAVALLAALVVVPPLAKAADVRGLFAVGPDAGRPAMASRRTVAAAVAGAVLAVGGGLMVSDAVKTTTLAEASPLMTESSEAPATIPPSTTAAPTTSLAPDVTLPPGPAERPSGLVAGSFYDALVGADIDPGLARCAADDLVTTTPEADLIAMGIATTPRPAEVDALLAAAATRCGITPEQLAAAAG